MLRVLIAENEAILAFALRRQLELAGCEVVGAAKDGRQAISLWRSERPDVVLMDVGLPVIDGITATRLIMREAPSCILILTGFGGREVAAEADGAGAMGCLSKPASAPSVLAAIGGARARFAEFTAIRAEARDLDGALAARVVIENAKRVVALRDHLDLGAAFRSIQASAAGTGQTLRSVALDILKTAESQTKPSNQ